MQVVITKAGLAAIVDAEATGTNAVKITKIGVGSGKYTPLDTATALVDETKKLDVTEGGTPGDNAIHVACRDDSADSYPVYEFGLFLEDGTLFAVYSQQEPILQKTATSQMLLSVDIKLEGVEASSITFGQVSYKFAAATSENAGIVALATEAETLAGTDAQKAVTPAMLAKLLATLERAGLIKIASEAEAKAGSDSSKAVTAATMKAAIDDRAASDQVAAGGSSVSKFLTPKSVLAIKASTGTVGLVELATEDEAKAGTDKERAVTPSGLKEAIAEAVVDATAEQKGVVQLATEEITGEGLSSALAVTPLGLKSAIDARAASEEEVRVGTEAEKFATPASLKAILEEINEKLSSLDERVTALEPTEEPEPEPEPEPETLSGSDGAETGGEETQMTTAAQEKTNGE